MSDGVNRPLTFGSLFAGIGGFDLGLERAGMECRWQVEKDPYCQKVLRKHWPNVGQWDDVCTFPPAPTEDWAVDLICGGFPCQDISEAGKGEGINGKRSGLWFEMLRVIRTLRPRFAIVENVSDLFIRGFGVVLSGLAESGFDAEWQCLPAGAFGAPHSRDRVFVLAINTDSHNECTQFPSVGQRAKTAAIRSVLREDSESLPYRDSGNTENWRGHWASEPPVGRVANGVSNRTHRNHGLGNAVVPQIAEWIGRRIIDAIQTSEGFRTRDPQVNTANQLTDTTTDSVK